MSIHRLGILLLAACGMVMTAGCQLEMDRQRPLSERTDEALRDPFSYSPPFDRGVSGRPWPQSEKNLEQEVDRVHDR
jgi:hypothetical protein